mmetsp:Transcript_24106/g.81283  ORF Transcript_24106/g.81283 Transcript_24106/m.81283 type:complete len:215 (+) Transcript_24106:296-940(+)
MPPARRRQRRRRRLGRADDATGRRLQLGDGEEVVASARCVWRRRRLGEDGLGDDPGGKGPGRVAEAVVDELRRRLTRTPERLREGVGRRGVDSLADDTVPVPDRFFDRAAEDRLPGRVRIDDLHRVAGARHGDRHVRVHRGGPFHDRREERLLVAVCARGHVERRSDTLVRLFAASVSIRRSGNGGCPSTYRHRSFSRGTSLHARVGEATQRSR